jgi:hypothetical protein
VPEVDARAVRFRQGVVAVVLLAGFVFRSDWVMPVLAVLLLAAAASPRVDAFAIAFEAILASRVGTAQLRDDASAVRFDALVTGIVLGLATGTLALGLGGVAWLLALLVAAVAALGAVAGISLAGVLYERVVARRR